jgi:F-type H+-transporting ATPase subunit b
MTMLRAFSRSVLLVSAGWANFALAAEEAVHHEPASIASLFWPVVNFAIFVGILARYAWPVVREALVERRKAVENELAHGDRARAEAQAALAAIEARRASLAAERERIIQQLRQEAEHDRAAIISAARKTAERIREDARLVGEQEADRTARTIREEIAARVVANVAAALRERVTGDDEARFIADFVATVEHDPR